MENKYELIKKMANNGSYTSDEFYAAYDRYKNTFQISIPRKRKKKVTDEKDRNRRNKKARLSGSFS